MSTEIFNPLSREHLSTQLDSFLKEHEIEAGNCWPYYGYGDHETILDFVFLCLKKMADNVDGK